MDTANFIAFDLGATSGRTILGTFKNNKLHIEELTRFPNGMVTVNGHLRWDIYSLYRHILEGFKAAAKTGLKFTSAGIDTWGVDVVPTDTYGEFIGLPIAYRDSYTEGIPAQFFAKEMSEKDLYGRTGIQIMNFNTVFQMYARKKMYGTVCGENKKYLFIPDALNYMLSGKMATEYTIASTSGMISPSAKVFDEEILRVTGLSKDSFAEMTMPGTVLGNLKKSIAEECGIECLPIVAVAGHDTASAVAAVPAESKGFAYLSSGTWSLMGIETQEPVINDYTSKMNITNEGGVDGTIRLLKNITGMWIIEQCLRQWRKEGTDYDYPTLVAMAQEAEPMVSFIDPDWHRFANCANMPEEIAAYCAATGQKAPENHAQTVRMIYESLAMKYRYVLDVFREIAPFPIEKLHIIGGGSKNRLLNSFTASATGVTVVAGPSEATAIGNILVQARAAGMASSLEEMRKISAGCVETESFEPEDSERWEAGYRRFRKLIDSTQK